MLSPQQFAAAWGGDRFCFPLDVFRDIDIPEPSKRFLLEAGLPKQAIVPSGKYVTSLPFVPATPPLQSAKYPLMAPFSSSLRLLASLHDENDQMYWGYDFYYAVEEKTGHIYYLEHFSESGEEGEGYVNASVTQFAEFLLVYRHFVAHFRPKYPESFEIPPLIMSLGQKWQEIDPVAMAHPDNYWASLLDDIGWQ
jgi:hypothetical protein